VKRSTGIGGVVANSHASSWQKTTLVLDSTVHVGSATTVSVMGALRSTWSKQAKTRWVMSMPT
jgi:hypothetical protein